MPIRRELRQFYGREWREVIRPRILKRAGDKCEQCGKPNGQTVWTLTGTTTLSRDDVRPFMFWTADARTSIGLGKLWVDQFGALRELKTKRFARAVRVVLTIAHLNHVSSDNRDQNLKALCQWCHLNHDKLHHKETRCSRKDAARTLLQEAVL